MAIASLFRKLEASLAVHHPYMILEAKNLATTVTDPERANPEQCWSLIWDKPLYANARVTNAAAKTRLLSPLLSKAWPEIGQPHSDFLVERTGKGSAVSSFVVSGNLATKLRLEFRIAPHRLFGIQGAALALSQRVKKVDANFPYANLTKMMPKTRIELIIKEMGPFWGHITTLHFLTDMGLACKPDIHLVRSAQYLGLIADKKMQNVPSLSASVEINEKVANLSIELYGSNAPDKIRYLDKVLMEISRQGIIQNSEAGEI
jgi:hypothetical protein